MAIVAAPVASFVTGLFAAGSTTGAIVGAVSGAVAAGAVTGAAIGAATAIVTGGDIFEGALKGAALGGITGGILSLGSMAVSGITQGAYGANAATQVSNLKTGVSQFASAGSAAPPTTPGVQPGASAKISSMTGPGQTTAKDLMGAAGKEVVKEAPKGILQRIPNEVLAGGAEGLMAGVGQVGAAAMAAGSQEDLAAQQRKDEEDRIARNQPGDFNARFVNLTLPETWKRYADAEQQFMKTTGLLNQTALA